MRRAALVLAAALALSGCATNAIRVERASTVVEAGREATGATRALVDETDSANRRAAIELAALDPACTLPEPVLMPVGGRSLCRDGAERPGDVRLTRFAPRHFAPALATIEALTAYLAAMDAVLADEPIDIAGGLASAEKALSGAVKLAGDAGLNEDQQAAVNKAGELIGPLVAEADKVRRLRGLASPGQRALFDEASAALGRENRRWTALLGIQLKRQLSAIELARLRIASPSLAERRASREQELAARERLAALPMLVAALDDGVGAMRASHAAYLELLDCGRGTPCRLTPEEQALRARLTRERLRAALSAIVAVAKTF